MPYEKSCGAVVFTRINGEIRYVLAQNQEGYSGFPKGHTLSENEDEEREARALTRSAEDDGRG